MTRRDCGLKSSSQLAFAPGNYTTLTDAIWDKESACARDPTPTIG
jgi:hypothetical protein